MNWTLTIASWAGIALLSILLGNIFNKKVLWKYALVFVALFVLDAVLMIVAKEYLNIGIFAKSQVGWWQIKLISIAWVALFLLVYKKTSAQDMGITFKLKEGSLKPVLIVGLVLTIVLFIVHYFTEPFGQRSVEMLAFEMTMPGISEELTYRAVFLTFLNLAFAKKWKLFGADIGYGFVVVSLVFGVSHALFITGEGQIGFSLNTFLITGFFSTVFTWMRERTGSIVPSVIAHNVFNTVSII